jgi:hypothetical protein
MPARTKGSFLAAPLLKYDLLLAQRSFADAFGTWRDRLLLALVAALVLLWLRDAATRAAPSLPPQAAMLALLAGPAAYAWSAAALRRIAWFREVSALAPHALLPRSRTSYLAGAQLPLLAILVAALLVLGAWTDAAVRAAGFALLSYGAGLALAFAIEGRAARFAAAQDAGTMVPNMPCRGAFQLLLARQTAGAMQPVRTAAVLVAGAAVATLVGCSLAASQPITVRFAASLAPSVLLLAASARNGSDTIGLLAFSGCPARKVAMFVCALPAANLLAVSVALLLARPEGWAGMLPWLLLLHLLAALIATARAWLSPGRAARSVDLQVQLEMLALLVVATLFAPLVPVAAAWRLWLLHRHYSRRLWIHN